jgi:hypothetical protein
MLDRQLRDCWKRPRPTDRAPAARTEAIARRGPRAVPVADLARGAARDALGLGLRLESSTVDEPYRDVTCNTASEQPHPITDPRIRTECHAHTHTTAGVTPNERGATSARQPPVSADPAELAPTGRQPGRARRPHGPPLTGSDTAHRRVRTGRPAHRRARVIRIVSLSP